jgi:aspartyl-tRNA(Asn)/glutamyl-tRNA(Gln) amidotransferase subunit A
LFEFSSIEQYHAQLKEGKVTCLQVTQHYLQRIHAASSLNAFIEVYADEAMDKARLLDQQRVAGEAIGKLHGVIIGLKDVICYKGHKLSAASRILQNFTSLYSATAVDRLLAEGAIIIGNLNCDEFAMGSTSENSAYGRVKNARDESRVPGGSSGGSAVAVQAGLCMVTLGSDTGGSVRQPADFCGIVGLKPGYGRVSRHGLIAYASSFDQIGIFGTNVPDVALTLEVIAGPDQYDSTVSHQPVERYSQLEPLGRPCRIAYFKEAIEHPSIDPEISSAIKQRLTRLQDEGHTVEAVAFDLIDYVVPAYYVLTTAEASSNLSRYDGVRYGYRYEGVAADLPGFYEETRSRGFGREVKRRIMLGTFVLSTGYYDAYFTRAQKVRNLLTRKLNLVFQDFDFLILPNSPETAFPAGEKTEDPIAMYLADIYTVMANLTGVPGISLPLFSHTNGMTFGLQVLSAQFNELPLLRFSNALMQRN